MFFEQKFKQQNFKGAGLYCFDRFLDTDISLQSNGHVSPRVNKDQVLDAQCKCLISLCKSTNLLIDNDRLHNDKNVGDFTF